MKKRGNTKAQVSVEFLIVVSFAFLMTIPLLIAFYKQSESLNTDIVAGQIDKIASEMRDVADEVYYLGTPSKKTVTAYFPEGVQSIDISASRIVFVVDSPYGDYEIVKWTAGNISGSLQAQRGIHVISVEAFDNYVSITE